MKLEVAQRIYDQPAQQLDFERNEAGDWVLDSEQALKNVIAARRAD